MTSLNEEHEQIWVEELQAHSLRPKTILAVVGDLEQFLVADFGQNDWSPDFIKTHFKICKDSVKRIQLVKDQEQKKKIGELMSEINQRWNGTWADAVNKMIQDKFKEVKDSTRQHSGGLVR